MLPTGDPNATPEEKNRMWRMMGMGWTLVTELIAGLCIGWLVDWALGFDKVFLIVGAVAGLLVGLWSFIRVALKENQRLEQERKDR